MVAHGQALHASHPEPVRHREPCCALTWCESAVCAVAVTEFPTMTPDIGSALSYSATVIVAFIHG